MCIRDRINGIDTTLPWEAEEEILAEISIDIDGDDTLEPLTTDTFESMIEEALLNALNSELGAVVGPLNAQLPQEHVICDVEVVDGELVVTTADRGLTQCRERRLAEAVPKKREAEKDGGRALRKMSFEARR